MNELDKMSIGSQSDDPEVQIDAIDKVDDIPLRRSKRLQNKKKQKKINEHNVCQEPDRSSSKRQKNSTNSDKLSKNQGES